MKGKPLHVGIVACSAEGAALCYRTICTEGAATLGPHRHPEVSMHGLPLADYVECLDRGDLPGVGALMLQSAGRLAAVGADFLVCPDNTIHQALPLVGDALRQLPVFLRLQMFEGQVFQLPLYAGNAQPVGQRGEYFQSFVRLRLAPGRIDVLQRAHVVQTVGQFDKDDPDIFGHGQKHFA